MTTAETCRGIIGAHTLCEENHRRADMGLAGLSMRFSDFSLMTFFFRSARVAAEECWNGRGRLVAVVSCCRLVNERVVGPQSVRVTSWTNIQPEWRGIYLSVRCRLDASYETLHNANQVYLNHTTAAVRVENVVPDTRILKPSNIYSRVESSVRRTRASN